MTWSELRADRVLREIRGLCAERSTPLELLASVSEAVHAAVPSDASCYCTFDPATTMVTSAVGRNLDENGRAAARFFELEYGRETPAQYQRLLASRAVSEVVDVARLDATEGHVAVREHLTEMGVGQEMRFLCTHQGAAWAGAGLMRSVGTRPFSAEEVAFAERVAALLTPAVRGSLVHASTTMNVAAEAGPAVLIMAGDQLAEATPAAQAWLEALSGVDRGHGDVPAVVQAVAARALAGNTVAQRARTADGCWVVLRAAPFPTGRAVVTFEVAGPAQVTTLLAGALGLTEREIDVVSAVLKGLATKEIAAELHLSSYTVQDHLKSVFAKAGVNSRRELVAEVFFGVYAPRLGSAVGADGFFR